MGGLMKVYHHGHGTSNRGQPYGLMLLIAFGAAIIGVMVVHKFRERRIFNLLLTEKDRELTALQLLLQKEREHARQTKLKLEEMKAKVNTLRTQKRGLDGKIMEMRSTISSLREEQRTIELVLEEKQNEIKLIRGRETYVSNDNPQLKALSQMAKQKESGVEELKNHLEAPVRIWSVSTDDPSNASINLQTKTSLTERDQANANDGKQVSAMMNESTNHEVADSSTEQAESGRSKAVISENEEQTTPSEDGMENGETNVASREEIGEQSHKVDDSEESMSEDRSTPAGERTDGDAGMNINTKSQSGEALVVPENNDIARTEAVGNHDAEVQRASDDINEMQTTQSKVLQTSGDGLAGKIVNAQGAENQDAVITYKGGMKLEVPDQPQIRQNRLERDRYLKKTKRKWLNKIHRSKGSTGNSVSKEVAVINENLTVVTESSSVYHDKKTSDDLQTGENSKMEANENFLEHGELQEDMDPKKAENNTEEGKDGPKGIRLLKQEKHQEDRNITTHLMAEKWQTLNNTSISTELENIPLEDTPTSTTIHIEEATSSEAKHQKQPYLEESEKQAVELHRPEERIDAHKDEVSEQTETGSNDKELDNPEMENFKETESESDASRESLSDFVTDGESNSDRSNEPEY
ncbi:centromere protein F-like [Coffea eugenioides]|uniref:centromere protein F-like n=2 Tax=Coffea eugenioides TaxID=49369 RepID=UPI000F60D295|nr:centromere protein F-like [Coffea eugenioides]